MLRLRDYARFTDHCQSAVRRWEGDLPCELPRAMRPLDQLELTIGQRKAAAATDQSYTAKLLAGGVAKIGAKVIEEATEIVEAAAEAGEEGRQHTIREAADVIYHTLVLLAAREIPLADVERELARRFNMSGLEEKASRDRPAN